MSVFIDVYSIKIVGWVMGNRMQDQLIIDAFNQAYHKERTNRPFRSRCSIYWSSFQNLLREKNCKFSMSRQGNPYDNSLMESFHKTLKRELINDANFATIEQAQLENFKYLETYYNPKRLH